MGNNLLGIFSACIPIDFGLFICDNHSRLSMWGQGWLYRQYIMADLVGDHRNKIYKYQNFNPIMIAY
jgi:hypothetical protein